MQLLMYKASILDFESLLDDRDLRNLLLFSIQHKLIDSFYPSNKNTANLNPDQLYFYEKLCLIVRLLYVHDGKKNGAFYQKLLDKIKGKYEKMLVNKKNTNKRVRKWIQAFKKENLGQRTKRTSNNSAVTIEEKRNGIIKRQLTKSGIHKKMKFNDRLIPLRIENVKI